MDHEIPLLIKDLNLLYKEEVYKIIGAAMEVHTQLGGGFLEAVYQEALEIEFIARGIPFTPQKELPVHYKGKTLKKNYVADFVAFDGIIIEIKSISNLTELEKAQVLNYLKATGVQLGLLINFGPNKLEWQRIVLTHPPHSRSFA
jgi:GxxExxY protein